MKIPALSSWQSRTTREQAFLAALAAILVVLAGWLLVVRPLGDATDRAKERHKAATIALAETRAQAAALRSTREGTPSLGRPIVSLISQSAAEAGFPVASMVQQGANGVTLRLSAVRPQAFFAWAAKLEESRTVVVERMSATANGDRTLSVAITFRARRG